MATGDRQRPAEAAPQFSVLHSIDGACVRARASAAAAVDPLCALCFHAVPFWSRRKAALLLLYKASGCVCSLVERSWFCCCRHTVLSHNCNVAREETKKPHQETERGEGNRWRDKDPAQADAVSERKESSAANIWYKFICALLQKVLFISVVAKAAPTNLVSDPYQD